MEIISKIECIDAIENLEEIIDETDYLLIDRGDLSKEVAMEKIPMLQKTIISEALKKDNLLETNEVSAKDTFGIRSDLKVPQFINKSDNCPKIDKNYVFEIHSIISNNNLTKYDNLITINLKS